MKEKDKYIIHLRTGQRLYISASDVKLVETKLVDADLFMGERYRHTYYFKDGTRLVVSSSSLSPEYAEDAVIVDEWCS